MNACISQACTLSSNFEQDLAGYAEGGCPAVEVWLTKLETHLQTHSAEETRQQVRERGLTLVAASYQGGLLLSQGEQRRAHFDHFKRRLELCAFFGIPTLVVAADFVDRVDQTALERAIVSLKEAGGWAQALGVRLALEFHARASFCACVATALALLRACGEANVGLCLDVFHYYTGPSKLEDLEQLTAQTLAHVQVCDLAGVARELATDADRILPGEGDFQLGPIVDRLRAIGYAGCVSLELFNPTLWQVPPRQVAELGWQAVRRLLSA